MDRLEQVEVIREKTGATYEEAKRALEATNWDMIDALLYIEALKKANGDNIVLPKKYTEPGRKNSSCAGAMNKFFAWCSKVVKRSWDIKFKIMNNGEDKITMPLLLLVLLMMCSFWITIPLMIVGMVCGLKYRFEGIDTVSVNLNDLSDKASSAIDDLKKSYEG